MCACALALLAHAGATEARSHGARSKATDPLAYEGNTTVPRLEAKVALITAAARGQGPSHALRLADEGADIIALDVCRQVDTVPYPMVNSDDLITTVDLVRSTIPPTTLLLAANPLRHKTMRWLHGPPCTPCQCVPGSHRGERERAVGSSASPTSPPPTYLISTPPPLRGDGALTIAASDERLLLGRSVVRSVHRSRSAVPVRGVLQAVASAQVDVEPLPPRATSSSSTHGAPEHVIAAFRKPLPGNGYERQSRHFESSSIQLGDQGFRPPSAVQIVHHPVCGMRMLGLTCAPCRR